MVLFYLYTLSSTGNRKFALLRGNTKNASTLVRDCVCILTLALYVSIAFKIYYKGAKKSCSVQNVMCLLFYWWNK